MSRSRSKVRASARSAQEPKSPQLTLSEFVYGDGGIERGALVQAERVGKLVHDGPIQSRRDQRSTRCSGGSSG